MKKYTFKDNDFRIDAFFDGELSPEEVRDYKVQLKESPEDELLLDQYNSISGFLEEFHQNELKTGEGISLWPEIRSCIEEHRGFIHNTPLKKRLFFLRRPAWIGFAASIAAGLILFFSGVFYKDSLPSNYCRINNIASPNNNYMIYQDNTDGLTIIWIME